MTTRKMSGREGYKTGPVRFGKEDLRSGKVEEIREKLKREEVRRNPLLASGPDSPPPKVSVADLQQQLKNSKATIEGLEQKLQESDFTEEVMDLKQRMAGLVLNIANKESEIGSLKADLATLMEEDVPQTIPDKIRIQSIKKINKAEGELRLLVDLSSPGLPTKEVQFRLPTSQLEIIQKAISKKTK